MSKHNSGQALQAAKAKIVTLDRKIEALEKGGREVVELLEKQRVLFDRRSEIDKNHIKALRDAIKDNQEYGDELAAHLKVSEFEIQELEESMKLWRLGACIGIVLTLGYTAAFFFGGM